MTPDDTAPDDTSSGDTSTADHPSGTETGHDAADEAASARDNAFSHAAEWHAFAHGVYKGLTTKPWKTPPVPDRPDVKQESHYYRGGYVAGTLVQVVILAAAGELTFDVTSVV